MIARKHEGAVIENPAREKPLGLMKLAKRIGISRTTIWRWTTRGSLGVVLETMQLGGVRCTSEEAWVRFCRRQQEAAAKSTILEPHPASAKPLSKESLAKAIAAGLAPKPLAPQSLAPKHPRRPERDPKTACVR
jgi:hypothetical protein